MSETDLAFINRIDKQNSFMAVSPDHERLRNLAWRGVRAAEDMELVRSQNAALRAENEMLRAALKMARPFIGWAGYYPTILAEVDAALGEKP